MNKNKLWNVLLIIMLALQAIVETVATVFVLRMNVLPVKFVILLIFIMLLLLAATGLLMFLRGKKPVSVTRRSVACVLALVWIVLFAFVSVYAARTYDTMHSMTDNTVTTNAQDMYVFVLEEDPAKTLENAKGYTFGAIADYNSVYTNWVITKIGEVHGQTPNVRYYSTLAELANALYTGEVKALIMNGVSASMLQEEKKYEDFLEKVRVLYTATYEEMGGQTFLPDGPDENDAKDITKEPFILYISGSDTRNATLLKTSLSDVNILMVVNPVTKQILLLNTPRDYFVPNPAGDGALDKLTHCGSYGPQCSIKALEDLYGINVRNYGQINFNGFKTLIDAVGGVTVYSEQSFTARDTYVQKGENYFNGAQALDYARERYHVSGGDNGRGKNQMKIVSAVIKKLTSATTLLGNYTNILESLEGTFTTNMQMEDISALVRMQLNDMASWEIHSFAVTGFDGKEVTYSYPGQALYVMKPDQNVVEQASGLVQMVIGGEKLTEEDLKIK